MLNLVEQHADRRCSRKQRSWYCNIGRVRIQKCDTCRAVELQQVKRMRGASSTKRTILTSFSQDTDSTTTQRSFQVFQAFRAPDVPPYKISWAESCKPQNTGLYLEDGIKRADAMFKTEPTPCALTEELPPSQTHVDEANSNLQTSLRKLQAV